MAKPYELLEGQHRGWPSGRVQKAIHVWPYDAAPGTMSKVLSNAEVAQMRERMQNGTQPAFLYKADTQSQPRPLGQRLMNGKWRMG